MNSPTDDRAALRKTLDRLGKISASFFEHSKLPLDLQNEFAHFARILFQSLDADRDDLEEHTVSRAVDQLKELAETWLDAFQLPAESQAFVKTLVVENHFAPILVEDAPDPSKILQFGGNAGPSPARGGEVRKPDLKPKDQALLGAFEHFERYGQEYFNSRNVSDILKERAIVVANITRALESLLNGNPALIEIDVERTEGKREKVFTLTKAGQAKARALLDQDRAAI